MLGILYTKSSVGVILSKSQMYLWNIIQICIHIEKNQDYVYGKRKYNGTCWTMNTTWKVLGQTHPLEKATHKLRSGIISTKQSIHNHHYHHLSFIITINRYLSWDILTSLMVLIKYFESLSIIHRFICILITDSAVKANTHCRCHHHEHYHHYQSLLSLSWS